MTPATFLAVTRARPDARVLHRTELPASYMAAVGTGVYSGATPPPVRRPSPAGAAMPHRSAQLISEPRGVYRARSAPPGRRRYYAVNSEGVQIIEYEAPDDPRLDAAAIRAWLEGELTRLDPVASAPPLTLLP